MSMLIKTWRTALCPHPAQSTATALQAGRSAARIDTKLWVACSHWQDVRLQLIGWGISWLLIFCSAQAGRQEKRCGQREKQGPNHKINHFTAQNIQYNHMVLQSMLDPSISQGHLVVFHKIQQQGHEYWTGPRPRFRKGLFHRSHP